jgi:hypothetical protein
MKAKKPFRRGRRMVGLSPDYMRRHDTFDSYFHRQSAEANSLSKICGFDYFESLQALTNKDNDNIAHLLRAELGKLRTLEKKGGANVRLGRVASRLEIADLALVLLENAHQTMGENLFCLLEELLSVDRHRASLRVKNSAARDKAAAIDANHLIGKKKVLGVRALAKQLSVSPSTVTEWRRSSSYAHLVKINQLSSTIEVIYE